MNKKCSERSTASTSKTNSKRSLTQTIILQPPDLQTLQMISATWAKTSNGNPRDRASSTANNRAGKTSKLWFQLWPKKSSIPRTAWKSTLCCSSTTTNKSRQFSWWARLRLLKRQSPCKTAWNQTTFTTTGLQRTHRLDFTPIGCSTLLRLMPLKSPFKA